MYIHTFDGMVVGKTLDELLTNIGEELRKGCPMGTRVRVITIDAYLCTSCDHYEADIQGVLEVIDVREN